MFANYQRRRLVTDTNASILGYCTSNNSSCANTITVNNEEVCEFYEYYGNSCISSYMAFGFLIIVFLMLPFICLGCYCMNDITTPLRVPTRILPVRKEY